MRQDQRGDKKRKHRSTAACWSSIQTEGRERAQYHGKWRYREGDEEAPAGGGAPLRLLGDILIPAHAKAFGRKLQEGVVGKGLRDENDQWHAEEDHSTAVYDADEAWTTHCTCPCSAP